MTEGGGWFGKLMQAVLGLIILGMVLGAVQAALYQVMPLLIVAGVLAAGVWLVWRVRRRRHDRW